MQAHRKRHRLPAIIKMSHCTLRKLGIPMTGISVFSPVPQGAEYGGPCRRRHNARAECRAAPALLTAYAVRLAVGNRFYAPRCSAAFLVFAGGAELRSGLCVRAVVCVENMRRASASDVCGTRDGTVSCLPSGRADVRRYLERVCFSRPAASEQKNANWKAQLQRDALYRPPGRRFCFALSGGRVCRAEAAAVSQGGAAA